MLSIRNSLSPPAIRREKTDSGIVRLSEPLTKVVESPEGPVVFIGDNEVRTPSPERKKEVFRALKSFKPLCKIGSIHEDPEQP